MGYFVKKTIIYRVLVFCLAVVLFLTSDVLVYAAPNALLTLTNRYNPPLLRGIKLDPSNPLRFEFIFDEGVTRMTDRQLQDEAKRLIGYFLCGLAIPEKELWVNLAPQEADRVASASLAQTGLGEAMLDEDYKLKQLAASLTYPDTPQGREYWNALRNLKSGEQGLLAKVWIVPQRATIYADSNKAYIESSRLGVNVEDQSVSAQALKDNILPMIEKEVNENQTFIRLRQMYHSLLLATWFKRQLRENILNQKYSDKKKTGGIEAADQAAREKIYAQYLNALKQGAYDYVKKDIDRMHRRVIARKYFAGGVAIAGNISRVVDEGQKPFPAVLAEKSVTNMVVDLAPAQSAQSVFHSPIGRRDLVSFPVKAPTRKEIKTRRAALATQIKALGVNLKGAQFASEENLEDVLLFVSQIKPEHREFSLRLMSPWRSFSMPFYWMGLGGVANTGGCSVFISPSREVFLHHLAHEIGHVLTMRRVDKLDTLSSYSWRNSLQERSFSAAAKAMIPAVMPIGWVVSHYGGIMAASIAALGALLSLITGGNVNTLIAYIIKQNSGYTFDSSKPWSMPSLYATASHYEDAAETTAFAVLRPHAVKDNPILEAKAEFILKTFFEPGAGAAFDLLRRPPRARDAMKKTALVSFGAHLLAALAVVLPSAARLMIIGVVYIFVIPLTHLIDIYSVYFIKSVTYIKSRITVPGAKYIRSALFMPINFFWEAQQYIIAMMLVTFFSQFMSTIPETVDDIRALQEHRLPEKSIARKLPSLTGVKRDIEVELAIEENRDAQNTARAVELEPKEHNGKWGYVDGQGKVVVPFQYGFAEDFSEELAGVKGANGKWGFIDKQGKVVVPFQYDETWPFVEGLAAVKGTDGKWGVIDKTGKVLAPLQYDKPKDAIEKAKQKKGEVEDLLIPFNGTKDNFDNYRMPLNITGQRLAGFSKAVLHLGGKLPLEQKITIFFYNDSYLITQGSSLVQASPDGEGYTAEIPIDEDILQRFTLDGITTKEVSVGVVGRGYHENKPPSSLQIKSLQLKPKTKDESMQKEGSPTGRNDLIRSKNRFALNGFMNVDITIADVGVNAAEHAKINSVIKKAFDDNKVEEVKIGKYVIKVIGDEDMEYLDADTLQEAHGGIRRGVAYIARGAYLKHKAAGTLLGLVAHELTEVQLWRAYGKKHGMALADMRGWIKANLPLAQILDRKFHALAKRKQDEVNSENFNPGGIKWQMNNLTIKNQAAARMENNPAVDWGSFNGFKITIVAFKRAASLANTLDR